ncbi:MAG: hypothetical protein AABY84_07955 [Candidatus Firestonebacteria bacterium]
MTERNGVNMDNNFRDFFKEVKPIKFKEPLAEILGAFKDSGVLEFTFADVVKMAGHSCPTVAGAYLCCQEAMDRLYNDEIPVRGEIAVTVYGEQDEGVYGVMGQVFSFLTGAATNTGFKGLGHKFKRKDLLKFNPNKPDSEAVYFEFKRLDNNKTVLVKFYPWAIPFPDEKKEKLGELLEKVIWEAAKEEEKKEFQNLWMEKVKNMLIERKEINNWLKIEER